MYEKGYIKDLSEAFSKELIGRGGKAYVERIKLTPDEAIAILIKAGAVPVLAQPGFLSQGPALVEEEIIPLIKDGLSGIEVYYSKHSAEQEEHYRRIAVKHNLLMTGGSDCHGQPGAENSLGTFKLPYKHVQALKAYKNAH